MIKFNKVVDQIPDMPHLDLAEHIPVSNYSASTPKETQIGKELTNLKRASENLQTVVKELLDRLSPVISPSTVSSDPSEPQVPPTAPLAVQMNETTQELRGMHKAISETLLGLEL